MSSYTDDLAETNSGIVRGLVEDERNPFAVRISSESRAVKRWAADRGRRRLGPLLVPAADLSAGWILPLVQAGLATIVVAEAATRGEERQRV